MTNFKGQTWIGYKKECKQMNVEPTRADWLGITYTEEELEAQLTRRMKRSQPKTMAASA
jgi:hypothetical protein